MFFNKKTEKRILESDLAANQIMESIDKDVDVFVMPKRFLGKKLDANQAQKTGAIILIFGFLFLIGAGAFIYFYVFSPNKEKTAANNSDSSIVNQTNTANVGKESLKEEATATSSGFAASENSDGADLASSTNSSLSLSSDGILAATATDSRLQTTEDGIPVIAATTTNKILTASPDSDGDGLTDLEEVVIGTKPTEKDSDGDSYNDLNELKNLYNPAGEGKLLTNSKFEIYSDSAYGYTLYYPDAWTMNDSTGNGTVIFKINDTQFAEVVVISNEKKQTLEEWYKEQFGVSFILPTQTVYKKGWTGIASEDSLHVYLADPLGDKFYSFFYNIGDSATLNYKNIFNLMIDSLK